MYRAPPDLEVRVKQLEQELAEARAEIQTHEREVWAARKTLRAQRFARSSAKGGYGAVIGSVAGVVAFVELEQPWFLFAGTILGFVFGGVIGSAWEASGSDNFPNVPPPRG